MAVCRDWKGMTGRGARRVRSRGNDAQAGHDGSVVRMGLTVPNGHERGRLIRGNTLLGFVAKGAKWVALQRPLGPVAGIFSNLGV